MQIDRIVCSEEIADKLESKHNVKCVEAEEVLLNQPPFVLLKRVIRKVTTYMPLLDKRLQAGFYQCSSSTS